MQVKRTGEAGWYGTVWRNSAQRWGWMGRAVEKLGTGVGAGMVRAGETGTGSGGDWRIPMLTSRFGIPKNGGYTRGDWWLQISDDILTQSVKCPTDAEWRKGVANSGFCDTVSRVPTISQPAYTLHAFHLLILSAPSGMPDLLPPHSSQLWGELAVNVSVTVLSFQLSKSSIYWG